MSIELSNYWTISKSTYSVLFREGAAATYLCAAATYLCAAATYLMDQLKIRLNSASVKIEVEVEVEAELGNKYIRFAVVLILKTMLGFWSFFGGKFEFYCLYACLQDSFLCQLQRVLIADGGRCVGPILLAHDIPWVLKVGFSLLLLFLQITMWKMMMSMIIKITPSSKLCTLLKLKLPCWNFTTPTFK